MKRTLFPLYLLATVGALASGCGAADPGQALDASETGTVDLAITTAPTGVQCISVGILDGYTYQTLSAPTFPVTAGASTATLSLGRLGAGTYFLVPQAYDVACGSIGTTTASWVSEGTTIQVRPGSTTKVILSLHAVPVITASATFSSNIAEVIPGTNATHLRFEDGTVKSSGLFAGSYSRTTFGDLLPTPITGVTALSAPNNGVCFNSSTTGVNCLGYNGDYSLGSNIALNATSTTPKQVMYNSSALGQALQLASGQNFTCALVGNGFVYCWGNNDYGQLGSAVASTGLAQMAMTGAAAITAGLYHACALTSGGRVWCWGMNTDGQVGNNTTVNATRPYDTGLTSIVGIAGGDAHTCALKADGSQLCWGSNRAGQLGDGTTISHPIPKPTSMSMNSDPPVQIAATGDTTCVRSKQSWIRCWGSAANGIVGDGSGTNRLIAGDVPGSLHTVDIRMGGNHICALKDDGSLWCWGDNSFGDLGDGTLMPRPVMTKVYAP
jgi:hypothetical protein